MPFFFHPDPTVRRKTGFLTPSFLQSDAIGFGVTTPFFWNLAPNYDVTFSPTFLTRQGLLMRDGMAAPPAERLLFASALAGIFQQDKDAFIDDGEPLSGDRDFRGSVRTVGRFRPQPRLDLRLGRSRHAPTGPSTATTASAGADRTRICPPPSI